MVPNTLNVHLLFFISKNYKIVTQLDYSVVTLKTPCVSLETYLSFGTSFQKGHCENIMVEWSNFFDITFGT